MEAKGMIQKCFKNKFRYDKGQKREKLFPTVTKR